MGPIKFFLSEEGDPWFNLALEDYIFRTMNPEIPVFFLWRNSPTVVMGRYQNPWIECHIKAIEEDHVKLARRQSGGGTVYHDWGNTNFSFMAGNDYYSHNTAFQIILSGLYQLGISARISERNDLIINNSGISQKFSGSAFRKLSDRSFHHGTLLLDTDLSKLQHYLVPGKKKWQAKGVKSVRSQVINLSVINNSISHDLLSDVLKTSFGAFFNSPVVTQYWKKDNVCDKPLFQSEYKKITSPSWIYGKTPPFVHYLVGQINHESVEAQLFIKQGMIEKIESADLLLKNQLEKMNDLLRGATYSQECIQRILFSHEIKNHTKKLLPKEISQFIIENIE